MTTCRFRSLGSQLLLVDAVCGCSKYLWGYSIRVEPGPTNCLPRNWEHSIKCGPFTHTRKRQHLQYKSPRIDFIARVLEAGTKDSPGFLRPEAGWNACDTPCTDWGSLITALRDRQHLDKPDRPAKIDPRHLAGFTASVRKLYGVLENIIRATGSTIPDWRTRWMKYSGTKREHYRLCALENEANPLHKRPQSDIFHEASVKWGELSSRARVLLVQTVRAIGTVGVKPGSFLRTPIMIEGGYRDQVEDALHHYLHRRGSNYVASGMDLFKRARVIRNNMSAGGCVLSLDWSSFDGTLGQLGVVERNAFLAMTRRMYGRDQDLDRVIASQNFCTVQGGPVRAKIYGNRGSGTAGTSTGNKVVVLAAIAYCLGPAFGGKDGVRLLCDGDDTLIFVPEAWRGENDRWIRSWVRRFSQLGLVTKVQQNIDCSSSDPLGQIRFCRAGVIATTGGDFLCKEPFDALKVLTNFRKHFRGKRFPDYLQTMSVGISCTYSQVPILREFATVFDVGGRVDADLLDGAGFEYMMGKQGRAHFTIDQAARDSFASTFGVSPADQIRCEQALREEAAFFKVAVRNHLSPP